jgi:FkbM family methyltransferase
VREPEGSVTKFSLWPSELRNAVKLVASRPVFSGLRLFYNVLFRGVPRAELSYQLIDSFISAEDVVAEVGVGHGGGTLSLAAKAGHVYAFEPNADSYRIARYFTRNKRNVTLFNVGVGEKERQAKLNFVRGEASAFGTSIAMLEGFAYRGHRMVRIVPLDIIDFGKVPTILILDCEGYEVEVLRGAKETLKNVTTIFIETHILSNGYDTTPEIISQLRQASFRTGAISTRHDEKWLVGAKRAESDRDFCTHTFN